ncbi:MAG: hypothetical protein E2598_06480 [Sphingobium sp.]|nr:hypothetical protein [Sphingobium sp.]
MTTTTLRQTHKATGEWTNLAATITGAAGVSGFIKHLGGTDVEIIFGGAAQPTADMRGTPLSQYGEEYCAGASEIWVRGRFGASATLGFNVVEA